MAIKKMKLIIMITIIGVIFIVSTINIFINEKEIDPVLWAIVSNEPGSLQDELEKGADVDKMSDYEMTSNGNMENNPLRIAADNKSDDCFNILLEYGADVNYVDKDNESLLMYTAACCDYSKFRSLLENGADVKYENNGQDIMTYAITAPHAGFGYDEAEALKIVSDLIQAGLIIKSEDLISLLRDGNVPSIASMKTLSNLYNNHLNNDIKIVGLEGCTINDLCTNNTSSIIRTFENTEIEFYMIGLCVAYDNIDVLEYYYNKGENLNIISFDGAEENLLMVAAAFNSTDCLKFLLDKGIACDIENGIFMTAVDYAKKYDNKESIQLLKRTNNL